MTRSILACKKYQRSKRKKRRRDFSLKMMKKTNGVTSRRKPSNPKSSPRL
jgi:hypothetical protein